VSGPDALWSGDRLERDLEGGVLTLRIANEERANALTERILDGLAKEIDGARPPEVRVVLLGGAGERHFSSGAALAVRGVAEGLGRGGVGGRGEADGGGDRSRGGGDRGLPLPGGRRRERGRDRRRARARDGLRLAAGARRRALRDAAGAARPRLHGRRAAAI